MLGNLVLYGVEIGMTDNDIYPIQRSKKAMQPTNYHNPIILVEI